ncbi:MAG: GNAT family N-acetyltransferase [Gammaproteobacteria bacterium]|jgi:tRNA(Met) cytidine acetyltransferase
MPANDIPRWMSGLLDELEQNRQRQLVSLQGSRQWCDAALADCWKLVPATLLISNRHPEPRAVGFAKAASCLGGETRLVFVDLFDGFDADVLCIASGLVRAGGVLVLLSPPPADWDTPRDRYARWQDGKHSVQARFVEYFFAALRRQADIGLLVTPRRLPRRPAPLPRLQPTPFEAGCTIEQAEIIAGLLGWLDGRREGVALISAARGRGKSSCLGLLAERLEADGPVLVTARSRQTASQLLRLAPAARFVAPDRLLGELPAARLLIVDEAASIPLPMLRRLVRHYPLSVMATTSGGYEGTGQGFMLRFVAELEDSELVQYRIEDPVRWCRGDRLEAWLDACLMQDAGGAGAETGRLPITGCRLQFVEEPGSPRRRALLREVYALLCSAHYRTRPSDLRMLMENPDLVLIVARLKSKVIGVALLNAEGGFDEALCEAVFLGQRRPRGHLLAQMLTAQAGCRGFAAYRGLRVQRIAVAPAYRRQGLGSRLIERTARHAVEQGFDYLGASFALDPRSSNFWRHAKCKLVHVSYAPGKSSGDHSVAVLRPIGAGMEAEIARMQQRLRQQLPTWLTQFLQDMDADQVAALLRLAEFRVTADELESDEIEAFTAGNRGFELCFASLQKYVMNRIAQSAVDPDRLLVEKAVQNRAWDRLDRVSGSEGRKHLQRRLRELVDALAEA